MVSLQDYTRNQDIMKNSMGSAVPLREVSHETHMKKLVKIKKSLDTKVAGASSKYRKRSFNIFKDPQYKDMRDKFHRTIDSKAYQSYL